MTNLAGVPIWESAHAITIQAFKLAAEFENDDKHKLADQVRESAIKLPVDLTKGVHEPSVEHFNRFMETVEVEIARLRYLLILARDLNIINDIQKLEAFHAQLEEFKGDLSHLQVSALVHVEEVIRFGR